MRFVSYCVTHILDILNVHHLYEGLKAVDWVMGYKILTLISSSQDCARCYNVTFSLERRTFQRKAWTTDKSPFASFST